MTDYTPQAQPDPNAQLGHEDDPFRFRGIVIFGVVFSLVCAVAMLIVYAAMSGFKADEAEDGVTTQTLVQEMEGDFPQPRLQTNDTYDMVEFRKREDAALSSYGWADRKAGIAQIPITRAIALLAEKGLPKVKAVPPGEESKPATDAKPAGREPGKKE